MPTAAGSLTRTASLASVRIDTAVVDPRDRHFDRAGTGEHLAGPVATVAHHQAAAALIALVSEAGDVVIHLGLQRLGQHLPCTLADQLLNHRRIRLAVIITRIIPCTTLSIRAYLLGPRDYVGLA